MRKLVNDLTPLLLVGLIAACNSASTSNSALSCEKTPTPGCKPTSEFGVFDDARIPGQEIRRSKTYNGLFGTELPPNLHIFIRPKDENAVPNVSLEVDIDPFVGDFKVIVGVAPMGWGSGSLTNFEFVRRHGEIGMFLKDPVQPDPKYTQILFTKADANMQGPTQEALALGDALIDHFTKYPNNEQPLPEDIANRINTLLTKTAFYLPAEWGI